jgi:hypothetical protein
VYARFCTIEEFITLGKREGIMDLLFVRQATLAMISPFLLGTCLKLRERVVWCPRVNGLNDPQLLPLS